MILLVNADGQPELVPLSSRVVTFVNADIQIINGWYVVSDDSATGGPVCLAHPNHDGPTGYRLIVPIPADEEALDAGEQPGVSAIYPCCVCGWEGTCEGGCHS